jgi:hypothetical protein
MSASTFAMLYRRQCWEWTLANGELRELPKGPQFFTERKPFPLKRVFNSSPVHFIFRYHYSENTPNTPVANGGFVVVIDESRTMSTPTTSTFNDDVVALSVWITLFWATLLKKRIHSLRES